MQKKSIKEVFNDYNEKNNLIETEIDNINLFKKTNKLQVKVISSKPITLQEIENFEEFLINKFKVTKASVDINYKDNLEIKENIEENWKNIIKYIGKKEPFSKAILSNSNLEKVDDQNILVKLEMKGASFLIAQNFDKGIEHILSNLYNKKYKIQFVENTSKEFEEKLKEKKKKKNKH